MLPIHPSTWPQRPLMIRPTPHTSMKVIGIRRAMSDEYEHFEGCSADCILPINDGKEIEGDTLVVDFESTFFVGTLLLRIKGAGQVERKAKSVIKQTKASNVEDGQCHDNDYFANKKRKFQAIIKGRFKKPLSMNRCVTGQTFDRPAGPLPARWVVKNFMKFISILAPQLDASLDADKPRFLTPLLATAQTVLSEDDNCKETPKKREKKNTDNMLHSSRDGGPDRDLGIIIPDTTSSSATGRAKARKKIFNKLGATKSEEHRFDCNKTYSFEFYQHLLEFSQFAVDMGSIGGMIPLAPVMDGQPLKILAAHRKNADSQELDSLWSFDIFHESLYPNAEFASLASLEA
eukprot:jgi/Psemu1/222025/e_gw1.1179.2.1